MEPQFVHFGQQKILPGANARELSGSVEILFDLSENFL
jgi:hypothetical protein